MDFFTMPDKAEGGFAYAYIVMIFVFLAASFTVSRLKRANKKQVKKAEALPQYDMVMNESGRQNNTNAE
ncbi:hypothetical protein SAMN05421736_10759 [Evansella caseinilytica]|uniref:Uncharacterized protein n=1 Tax=Evansella caseinilytica TaxID=1503961 RepID=A0A1H3QU31_9BACI|nr:hypothetical protein [Evansella caseinilytica]SDZ17102.1 hypothetical protein SAMN05421736_10759 [Evansella caseinilytica]